MPDLAAILDEGEGLEQHYDAAVRAERDSTASALYDARCVFYAEHGPLLLRLARRGAEMREAFALCGRCCEHLHHAKRDQHEGGTPCPVEARVEAASAAWDAAASGEETSNG